MEPSVLRAVSEFIRCAKPLPTCTGLVSLRVWFLSCTEPHIHNVPSILRPTMYGLPTAIWAKLLPICTGLSALTVEPLPNCPLSLSPQVHNVPSLSTAAELV